MTKEQVVNCKAKNPGAIAFFRECDTYKAYEGDAQRIYSVLMNRPMERLGSIAEVIIQMNDLEFVIRMMVKAGCRVSIFEDNPGKGTVGVG